MLFNARLTHLVFGAIAAQPHLLQRKRSDCTGSGLEECLVRLQGGPCDTGCNLLRHTFCSRFRSFPFLADILQYLVLIIFEGLRLWVKGVYR